MRSASWMLQDGADRYGRQGFGIAGFCHDDSEPLDTDVLYGTADATMIGQYPSHYGTGATAGSPELDRRTPLVAVRCALHINDGLSAHGTFLRARSWGEDDNLTWPR